MKLINKSNGRTIAEGRLELSKITEMKVDTEMGANTWVYLRYFCDNLIKKKGDYNFLDIVTEITIRDSYISVEASGIDYANDTEIRADVQFTAEERERFFVHIINHILGKVA